MIYCVIIDDEQQSIDTLTAMLQARFAGKVSVAATTTDSRNAASIILQYQPQIVFMDIEMPHVNGIQLMQSLPEGRFVVIFTTAHDRYALQAIKTEAIDYLLKPISMDELREALERAHARLRQMEPVALQAAPQKLLLPATNGLLAASISDIIRVESSSSYSTFYISGKPRIVVARTLKEYEEQLTPHGFFRIHQSHLVNLHHVEYFHTGLEEYVILSNGEQVEVSRRRKADFLQRLSKL